MILMAPGMMFSPQIVAGVSLRCGPGNLTIRWALIPPPRGESQSRLILALLRSPWRSCTGSGGMLFKVAHGNIRKTFLELKVEL